MKKFKQSKIKLKKAAVTALAVLMLANLTACATYESFKSTFIDKETEPEATVRIGVFEPLSGEDKEKGELELQGIELAHEMFPKALGKEVELIYGDNKSDMYVAESVAKELVDKRVSIVLGSYGSANSLIAVKIFEEAKIPAIAITNTNPLVTSYNPFYFRVCLLESFQGTALAKYAVESLGVKTAAILKPENDDYAIAVSQTFSDKMVQMTGDSGAVVVSCDYKSDTNDFTEELKKIKKSKAEVIFLPEETEISAQIMIQAKKLGITASFLGTDHWDSEDFVNQLVSQKIDNVSFSTVFDPNTGTTVMSDNFIKAYKAKYGQDAVPDSAVALGFDAYMIAVDSLNKAETALDGDAIRKAVASTEMFPGSSGTITFDGNGDPIKSVVVKTITSGAAIAAYTMEPQLVNLAELSAAQAAAEGN